MSEFKYQPSKYVPFRDLKAIAKARKITREDFERHPNPKLKVRVVPDFEVWFVFMMDVFFRIKEAIKRGKTGHDPAPALAAL